MPRVCWCDRRALDALCREARRWRVRETGGALLGWRGDGDEPVVAAVLGPGPDAHHGFSSFEPNATWQNRQGADIYESSGRTIAYVGDWHTHPRSRPEPSRQDRKTAREIAGDEAFRTPRPLYAIAGRRSGRVRRRPWQLALWEHRDGQLHPLTIACCTLDVPALSR